MKSFYFLFTCLCLSALAQAQCPSCGNGSSDVGETQVNCPMDMPHASTCISPCGQPGAFESAAGIRISRDFTGTTTYSTTGLPAGWSFAGAPSASTAGTLPTADVFGAKAGLVQPNCSGSCTGTNFFCIGNIANSIALGAGGASGGKLGTNFDGRPNIAQNLSYAVLRGTGSPTLVSETFNFSGVEGFKIQFWLSASESSCGTGAGWGSCVGNEAFLDFSANGGTSWTQVLRMSTSTTNTDMCTNNSGNTLWFKEGAWSRVCLTVFKTATSPGNFYPAAKSTTAASGIMLDPQWFTANFKFRVRYSQTASCTNATATNPGRYLAIDYPTVTSGNQLIPCGISFANLCGYGADNNDDGVGGSGTTTATAHGTVKRSINNAERGVEIFNAQTATFASSLNNSGTSLPSNHDLCNAEGGDKQCIDWSSNNNGYFVVYECITDWEAASGTGINVNYYKGTAPASFGLTKVTASGKTAALGWRYTGSRFVNCSSTSDLNAGCNGYQFQSASLPTQFARGFYALATNGLGEGWSFYGSSSCSHYFNGPFIAPIAVPDPATTTDYTVCSGSNLVFTGTVNYCSSSSGFSGNPTLVITGPGGFSETIASGGIGINAITTEGEYTIKAQVPNSPAQCLDCGRVECVTVTALDLGECITTPLDLTEWSSEVVDESAVLLKWSFDLPTDMVEFQLERSSDGVSFNRLATMPRLAEQTHYQWLDAQPLSGSNYYRLKARLANGSLDSTAILVETIEAINAVRVYPNPAHDWLRVTAAPATRLQLHDATGRLLLARTMNQATEELDLQQLPNGIYWLRYWIGTEGGWRKIVIGR